LSFMKSALCQRVCPVLPPTSVVNGRSFSALGILRGLIERDSPRQDGRQVEIVVELGLDAKHAALPKEAGCSVKVVAGAGFEPATFRL
jgi:hypothetical protein